MEEKEKGDKGEMGKGGEKKTVEERQKKAESYCEAFIRDGKEIATL
jgi:hypothetical protein